MFVVILIIENWSSIDTFFLVVVLNSLSRLLYIQIKLSDITSWRG
jgi:hypothetical protein